MLRDVGPRRAASLGFVIGVLVCLVAGLALIWMWLLNPMLS